MQSYESSVTRLNSSWEDTLVSHRSSLPWESSERRVDQRRCNWHGLWNLGEVEPRNSTPRIPSSSVSERGCTDCELVIVWLCYDGVWDMRLEFSGGIVSRLHGYGLPLFWRGIKRSQIASTESQVIAVFWACVCQCDPESSLLSWQAMLNLEMGMEQTVSFWKNI